MPISLISKLPYWRVDDDQGNSRWLWDATEESALERAAKTLASEKLTIKMVYPAGHDFRK